MPRGFNGALALQRGISGSNIYYKQINTALQWSPRSSARDIRADVRLTQGRRVASMEPSLFSEGYAARRTSAQRRSARFNGALALQRGIYFWCSNGAERHAMLQWSPRSSARDIMQRRDYAHFDPPLQWSPRSSARDMPYAPPSPRRRRSFNGALALQRGISPDPRAHQLPH